MKSIKMTAAMSALVLSMASCSKSELYIYDCECNGKNDSCYLKVTDVNKEGYYLTRTATEKESFGDGDAIGLWIDDGVNATYNGVSYENIQLEKETQGWRMQQNVALTKSAAKVYALFPYNVEQTSTSVALSVDDDTDYLYDIATNVSNAKSAVSLTMKHVRSKLVVRIERDDYTGNGIINNGTIDGSALYVNGNFDLKTEKLTSSDNVKQITFSGTIPETGTLEEEWFVFSAYGTATSNLSFTFTIDGVTYTTVKSSESVKFEKGKKYIYNIFVGNHKVEVSQVDIQPWGEGANENLGVTD
ncbi:MAG: fimbrillin family protein [Prevotella sp.]